MAPSRDEKTEAPTPRKREEARKQGQVARSQDLSAAALILSGMVGLALLGPGMLRSMLAVMAAAMTSESNRIEDVLPFAGAVATEALERVAPFLVLVFLAALASVLPQVGLTLSFKPLMPSLSKISPIAGFKRLFSMRSVMLAVTNFGKLLVVGTVGYFSLVGSSAAIIYAVTFGFHDLFALGSAMTMEFSMKLAAALVILALLDLVYQRYQHERDLKMTKEEVKDELRSMEGDPKLKRRRREIQLQLSQQQVRQQVPQADVIITNPTHVSVAIRYDSATMPAPKVVAKGADHMALRIRQVAMEFGIPIVQRPPLARAIYAEVNEGEFIPERLYQVIAEILAYVYELSGQSPVKKEREMVSV